ncbi:MAG: bifunctional phosphopantothenoylcysteine decarboxylase/phosphopantothenate synthase [Gemmataceae bacterium]|jgi:phosphopantothenate-cysteine ligase/phosphopantothenoylcysteine decarboxylase/phosphopantothenate--cysteine ligase|nr:bifunctional phosphopantothenoylcysteine decarboxylase/phosphopantothenate synthase [Gemmataceae bacterium]
MNRRPLRILITAGNTQAPLDTVRCVTNIFTGKTGFNIAWAAAQRQHEVTLLTSHPEPIPENPPFRFACFQTFHDLENLLESFLFEQFFDVVIHAAAVSDFLCDGIFSQNPDTGEMIDVSAGKIKSSHPNLWIRMKPAPKLIDKIRTVWDYQGYLVKFKLEVGIEDSELLAIAETSRVQSQANLMCANTFEGRHDWAFLGPIEGTYHKIPRSELATRLMNEIEQNLFGQ